jgi:tRNA A-37 threonylcarbamoyl transferase component Bud32
MPEIDHIGKYEVRREIGRGAMGVVYEAYDPMIKRVVALKTIRKDQLTDEDSAQMINRFRREAQAAGRLNHPNIVSIYDFGEEGGTWYIAMECVQGRELKACFEANERFRIADIVRIMKQILGALDYSHRQGVVHRDVKPANIFLLGDGSVKVADFGIAHIEASNLTQVGTVLGTPSYMSPEQILGLPVDGRSDLFSAGVILYQFLTGERPFSGSSTTTMQKVLKEDPLPPSSLNVQVLPVMDAVVRRALAKHADERYQTAQEFIEAIDAAVQAAPSGAAGATLSGVRVGSADATVLAAPPATAGTGTATTPPRATPSPPLTTASASPPPGPSRVPAGAIVAVAVAVAVAGGAWFAYQRFASDATHTAQAPPATPSLPAPVGPPPTPPKAPAPAAKPGTITIAAVGLVDPADPRFKGDKAQQQDEARADAKSQVVAKALGLLVDSKSLALHYDLLKSKLLANSGAFIDMVVRESEPQVGKDGLMAVTTEAVVNVKALQKSLNEMTRDERVEIIRASGDPKVSVSVTVRDADHPDAPPQPSPVAENLLKERIRSFGFRTWAEGAPEGKAGADFAVSGEAKVKKLTARLEASGLPITKYTLTSWTVKCTDATSGEEIYFNTALPTRLGTWNSEEEALKAIGARIADEFSRDFFLQHANVTSRKVSLAVDGLPDAATEDALGRELLGIPSVIAATPRPPGKPRVYDVQLAGSAPVGDIVAAGILKPLNAKLGQSCFALGSVTGDTVAILFDKACATRAVLSRLESNPPAGLYGAPLERQKSVIRDPATLKKLTT